MSTTPNRYCSLNSRPACRAAVYAMMGVVELEPYRGELVAYCGLVARNVVFADPRVFEVFGLPRQLSPGNFRPAR